MITGERRGEEGFEGNFGFGLPVGEVVFNKAGGGLPSLEDGVGEDSLEELKVGGEAEEDGGAQGGLHFADGGGTVFGEDDDFGDQRVVVGGEGVAGLESCVDTDARAGGRDELEEQTGSGEEATGWVLGVEAGFDGMTYWRSGIRYEKFGGEALDDAAKVGAGALQGADDVGVELDGGAVGFVLGLEGRVSPSGGK